MLKRNLDKGWAGMLFALAILMLGLMQPASAGITSTKHNLSSSGTGSNHVNGSGTAEICVFCHTPHGAAAAGASKPPLWNKALPASGSYTTYSSASSSTIDGNVSLANSVSLACLSCHDGSQAMDNMINAPGSGGYNSSGASPGYTWVGSATMPSSVALLGTDLSNDHPVGIEYCGGGLAGTGTTVSGTCADSDFKNGSNDVKTKQVGSTQVFWVDTGTSNGTREKTDLPLYNNAGNTGPSVECASCHDPHSDTNATFLRVANTGSAVCLTCHVK